MTTRVVLTDVRLNMLMKWSIGTDAFTIIQSITQLNKPMTLNLKQLDNGCYDVYAAYGEDDREIETRLLDITPLQSKLLTNV
jgi:hypothetical protein